MTVHGQFSSFTTAMTGSGKDQFRVTELHVFPVKSCRGTSLDRAEVGRRGFIGDRDFMLVDPAGRFITQREHSRLALVHPRVDGAVLTLSAPGQDDLAVDVATTGTTTTVNIWNDWCQAIDQGDAAAAWLGEFLGIACRLVRVDEYSARRVNAAYAVTADDEVGYADGYPFLLISEGSLAELNKRMPAPLPMERFRPNIVIAGDEPFVEDRHRHFRVGGVTFTAVKPCSRCAITTIDQSRGERDGKEPLRTLAQFRRAASGGVLFGQNLIHAGSGEIAVDDIVEVLDLVD